MRPSFVSRLFSHVSQQSHEAAGWLKRYARHPRNVGSVLPSSKMLGRAMTSAALRYGARDALFIEAGAGNGAITRVLAQSLAQKNRLVACEFLEPFALELQRRMPEIEVACCKVQDLPHWQEAGNKTIVSSLPFRSLAKDEARAIGLFLQSELHKNPQSVLVQFTYGLKNPVPLLAADTGIESFRHAVVWRNSPPAAVWVYRLAAGRGYRQPESQSIQ